VSGTHSERMSFVVFSLGVRRFALPTTEVIELARDGDVQRFPHTTAALEGVMVRRGEILPVWPVSQSLPSPFEITRRFWLVTRRNFAAEEKTAIPVSGECQMVHGEMLPPPEGSPAYVRGVLALENQEVEVLDLSRLENCQEPVTIREWERAREGT
jgi:chemotaxis signal transduction protein